MINQILAYLREHRNQIPAFSSKVGFERDTIENILAENIQLTFAQLSQIALKLKVTLTELITDSNQNTNFQFRSNAQDIKQVIVTEKAEFLINSLHPILIKHAEPSQIPNRQSTKFSQNAEFAADIVRSAILSNDYDRPLLDLASLISEQLNIFILVKDVGADGTSAYIDGYAYIIVSPRFAPRMLFTLAHELGHLILQHHQNGLHIDFSNVGSFKKNIKNKLEHFANSFGSNLLMPASAFAQLIIELKRGSNVPADIIGDFEMLLASYYFGVSFEAAAMRCEQLDLIPVGSAQLIYKAVKKEYKTPERRGRLAGTDRDSSPVFPIAASANVLQALYKAIEQGEISASRAANILGIDLQQLFDLHSQSSDELYN